MLLCNTYLMFKSFWTFNCFPKVKTLCLEKQLAGNPTYFNSELIRFARTFIHEEMLFSANSWGLNHWIPFFLVGVGRDQGDAVQGEGVAGLCWDWDRISGDGSVKLGALCLGLWALGGGQGGPGGVRCGGVQWGWAREWPGQFHFFSSVWSGCIGSQLWHVGSFAAEPGLLSRAALGLSSLQPNCSMPRGISVLQPETEPASPAVQRASLAPGPPQKPLDRGPDWISAAPWPFQTSSCWVWRSGAAFQDVRGLDTGRLGEYYRLSLQERCVTSSFPAVEKGSRLRG